MEQLKDWSLKQVDEYYADLCREFGHLSVQENVLLNRKAEIEKQINSALTRGHEIRVKESEDLDTDKPKISEK